MTRKQFRSRVRELIRNQNKEILKRMEIAIDSNCLRLKEAGNNFILPKMFMSAVCQEMSYQWEPLSIDNKWKREMNTIKYYI